MGIFVAKKKMDISNQQTSSSSTKTERKIVEKNRRNQMKNLYSKLTSLIPDHHSKEAMALPDRIDEAVNYIKSLQASLEKSKEKKESLMEGKRFYTCIDNDNMDSLKSPQIDIRLMGSSLQVIFISGQHNELIFYDIIRLLHEEKAEIMNANISVSANSVFLVVHAEIGEAASSFGAARINERLNKLVLGSYSEIELEPELWDFEICPEVLDL